MKTWLKVLIIIIIIVIFIPFFIGIIKGFTNTAVSPSTQLEKARQESIRQRQ